MFGNSGFFSGWMYNLQPRAYHIMMYRLLISLRVQVAGRVLFCRFVEAMVQL